MCALKKQACGSCLLRRQCTYALAFETAHALEPPENGRMSVPPHPMVLEPPLTFQQNFQKNEVLECNLILFGKINENLPYFIYAFKQMGQTGLGKRIKGRRAGFDLISVSHNDRVIYSENTEQITLPENLQPLSLEPQKDMETDHVSLNLLTPLRLQQKTSGPAQLPFQVLIRSLIRRNTALLNTWGNGEPDLDYSGLTAQALEVETAANDLSWFDWERYSARQGRKMPMGGLVGEVTYNGDLTPFMSFLLMSEKVHAGKNTAFGLGMFNLK